MNFIHLNDRIYALERAVRLAEQQGEGPKVQEDLREMLAKARRDVR